MSANPGKVLFLYWGRRGALSWIALEIARDLHGRGNPGDALSFSTENELASDISALSPTTWPFPTFAGGIGAVTRYFRFRRQAAALLRRLWDERFDAVVVLMSHVWTPLLGRRLRRAPIRYVVVAHDAVPHPGDPTGRVQAWLHRDLAYADRIVTLSRSVADELVARRGVPRDKIATLPHPFFAYGERRKRRRGDGPLRVLFLGRIMAYKGLDLLVSAVEILAARGVPIALGVYGEGSLDGLEPRLAGLKAALVNRWIEHREIGAILAEYDVLALPYVEASQSGVAGAAQGAGMPMVATPVGGLAEQVRHETDGLLAADVTAEAFADALERLATEPDLYDRLAEGARSSAGIGIAEFAERLREIALRG